MKILLTGGAGYIGSHVAAVLAGHGHDVLLYDNLSNSSVEVVGRLEAITGKAPAFVQGDVLDTDLLARTLQAGQIEAVMHFAGLKIVGESLERPIDYYADNVQGAISLLQAMRAAGTAKLVFSSSAAVYGDPRYLPIDEAHPTSPTNPYGRTKLHIEEMLADVAAGEGGWQIVRLRYFNPVGAHDSGLLGEKVGAAATNLAPHIVRVAAGEQPYLSIFGGDYDTPDGTGVRDFIHVMDLAEGHVAALEHLGARNPDHAVFNLGTGSGTSVREMVAAFAAASGKSIPCQVMPRRPGDVASSYAKADRAAQHLNWKATRTLDDMCASLWHYYRRSVAPSALKESVAE